MLNKGNYNMKILFFIFNSPIKLLNSVLYRKELMTNENQVLVTKLFQIIRQNFTFIEDVNIGFEIKVNRFSNCKRTLVQFEYEGNLVKLISRKKEYIFQYKGKEIIFNDNNINFLRKSWLELNS
jgi:hypothetical protein